MKSYCTEIERTIIREIARHAGMLQSEAKDFYLVDKNTWRERLAAMKTPTGPLVLIPVQDAFEPVIATDIGKNLSVSNGSVFTPEQVAAIKKIRETLRRSLMASRDFYFVDPSTWETRLFEEKMALGVSVSSKPEDGWSSEDFERLVRAALEKRQKKFSSSSDEASEFNLDTFDEIRGIVAMFDESRKNANNTKG